MLACGWLRAGQCSHRSWRMPKMNEIVSPQMLVQVSFVTKSNSDIYKLKSFTEQFFHNELYFEVNFLIAKKIYWKNFVRDSKYTKMSVFSCILFWDINFENPLNRFKAAMFFLRPLKLKILILSSEYLVNRWRYCSTVKYYLNLTVIMCTNFWPIFLRIPR